jgi:hypothetical protein
VCRISVAELRVAAFVAVSYNSEACVRSRTVWYLFAESLFMPSSIDRKNSGSMVLGAVNCGTSDEHGHRIKWFLITLMLTHRRFGDY